MLRARRYPEANPREAGKIVKGLENEAQIAATREASLRNSLNEVKPQASGLSDAEIKLRALEREAKAIANCQSDLPATATRAPDTTWAPCRRKRRSSAGRTHDSALLPQTRPISLLVAFATALLALTYVLARALIGAPAMPRQAARLRARWPQARAFTGPRGAGNARSKGRQPDVATGASRQAGAASVATGS